jgi:hypothetical protein
LRNSENALSCYFSILLEATMIKSVIERQNPLLQVDPELSFAGEMTFGEKLTFGSLAIVFVLGTLYMLVHQAW